MNNLSKSFKKLALLAVLLMVIGIGGTIVLGRPVGGGTVEETVDMTEVNHVNIRTSNQRVRVRPTSENQARITSTGMPTDATLTVEVVGDVLEVQVTEPRFNLRVGINFSDFMLLTNPPSLDVYLPQELYESIRITTSNSRIEVSDVMVEALEIRTINGRIGVADVEGENMILETTNGRIEIRDVIGNVRANSTNGRIEFIGSTIAGDLQLQTNNARINVNLRERPENADFSLSTTNGRTRIFGENRTHQTFGNGTYEVRLQTTNGRIEVE